MSYIYGCKNCGVSFEIERKGEFRCESCGGKIEIIATERWLFRCVNCGEIVKGSPESEVRTFPCPFCDKGILVPYKPG